jgi:hypothetical protein
MIKKLGKKIRNAWRSIDYRVQEIGWEHPVFVQPLIDTLEIEGIALGDLNRYLDEHDFPMEIGRLPQMILVRDDLVAILQEEYKNFLFIPEYKTLQCVERKNKIIDILAKKMASAYFS